MNKRVERVVDMVSLGCEGNRPVNGTIALSSVIEKCLVQRQSTGEGSMAIRENPRVPELERMHRPATDCKRIIRRHGNMRGKRFALGICRSDTGLV